MNGKWAISGCEERWPFTEVYDTRGDALDAVTDYCAENGIDYAFVGKARLLTYGGLLTTYDVEKLAEAMEGHEDTAGCEESVVELGRYDLEALRDHIVAWMNKNLDPINWYVVEDVTEHKR